jgi:hypothetical protein
MKGKSQHHPLEVPPGAGSEIYRRKRGGFRVETVGL